MMFSCDPGADHLIARFFRDCVYNLRDYVGFMLGLASIVTWIIAQLPQIIHNYRTKSAEALSVWFLAEWLAGDTCNLIGCLLTGNQLVTQIYTAMYFVFADVCLCLQYVYYNAIRHRRQRNTRNRYRMISTTGEEGCASRTVSELSPDLPLISQLSQTSKPRMLACVALVMLGSQVLSSSSASEYIVESPGPRTQMRKLLAAPPLLGKHHNDVWRKSVGQIIGWVSSLFYLGSRAAQIYKNHVRQSAEGLSLAMFACAISANVFYGLGILFRTYSWYSLVSSAPWLLGSLGTVALDVIIFCQFSLYKDAAKRQGESLPEPEQYTHEPAPSTS